MDNDEILAFVIFGVCALVGAIRWLATLLAVSMIGRRRWVPRLVLLLFPVFCLCLLQMVLLRWAAHEVRAEASYDALFLTAGAAWLTGGLWGLLFCGLDVRRDAVEQDNAAAQIVVCGHLLGVTLCFSGSNIGEGQTIWTTFFPATVSTALLFVFGFGPAIASGGMDAILFDRDAAAGWRLAGLLVSVGLLLGRAAAGNWVSASNTLCDFAKDAWPAVLLAMGAALVHRSLRPTPRDPRPRWRTAGLGPALAYVAIATAWLIHLGWWK